MDTMKSLIKPLSEIRLETVYLILNLCRTPTSGFTIRQNQQVRWAIIDGYVRFLLRKNLIEPKYEIEKGMKVCKYLITPKGIELLSMLQDVYDILSII